MPGKVSLAREELIEHLQKEHDWNDHALFDDDELNNLHQRMHTKEAAMENSNVPREVIERAQRTHQSIEQDRYHFFWGGPFSQWLFEPFDHQFELEAVRYNCTEQAMMAAKALLFEDEEAWKNIMEEPHPRDQKAWGRKVQNFDVDKWNEVARDIVYKANWAKFTQNSSLKHALMNTGDKILVEASPYDKIWGIGLSVEDAEKATVDDWQGTNWLGQVITLVREDIRADKKRDAPINWNEIPWK